LQDAINPNPEGIMSHTIKMMNNINNARLMNNAKSPKMKNFKRATKLKEDKIGSSAGKKRAK